MPDPTSLKDDLLQGVSVDIRVCVGSASPTIKDLMQLEPDSILPLSTHVDDPVELYVGDKLIAKGFLETSPDGDDGSLSVRLTAVGDPTTGLK
ncbi:flagellar motor switch protein FliN/FliY [Litoreibacter ascidiaceicola]|uniref:Flagellar motor switch protein FliN/FliY n=1 Tax=Litoreibacter ascidiaceicola TaxID=1486859 RepID=A0A1M5AQI0_9RHOB|nr:FliM/FliN family flagellar motor C-terminal domain-containing protein [Litoreibacter ascidiaceicola]SHF32435.1 flagellar motor switch protein FliN/FliY [Litoreibacter ascidiaceicola]